MTGSVVEIQSALPERLSSCIVQAQSGAAFQKFHMSKTQHAHQHQGVMLFFFIRDRPQGDGTGDIGGSLVILSTGIYQVQASCLQARALLRHGMVMAQCRVFPICGDCVEADIQRSMLSAHLVKTVSHAALIHRDLADILFQPVDIFCHDHTIGDMGLLHIFNLGRIFLSLGIYSRIHLIDDLILRLHALINGKVHAALLQKDAVVLQLLYIRINVIVGTDGHAQGLQVRADLIGDHLRIYIEEQALPGYHQIGQHHRIARNIVASDIEQPDNVVQRGDDMHIRVSLLHGFAQVFNLLSSGLSCVFFFQDPYRLCGKLRAVFPDFADQVMLGTDGCLLPGKTLL